MRQIKITASDGFQVESSYFEVSGDRIVVINSATGVPQKIYKKFALYLNEQGISVLTYDYRGIGLSRKAALASMKDSMTDWALKDAQAALDFAIQTGKKVSVIGHSFGGQCLGLLKDNHKIDKVLMVGAQLGYWRYFPIANWPELLFLWYVLFPIFIKMTGYFPAKKLGIGEDLPPQVAIEWRDWCCHPLYLYKDVGKKFEDRFDKMSCKMTYYLITDDKFAPRNAVLKLADLYSKADKRYINIRPKDFRQKSIGHFGAFRENLKDSMWPDLLNALR